jgi:hypothetical protein
MKRNNAGVNSIANVIVIGEVSDCYECTDEFLPHAHLVFWPYKMGTAASTITSIRLTP